MPKKIYSQVIFTNDAINICYEASKSCYASELSYDIETRKKYIGARIKEGHSSISEHSNAIYFLRIPKKYAIDLVEFLASTLFLYTCVKLSENNIYLLIGGSSLAFNHTIANMYNQINPILIEIKNLVYESFPECFFRNLTNTHMLQSSRFVDETVSARYHWAGAPIIKAGKLSTYQYTIKSMDDSRIEFINVDPIRSIYHFVNQYANFSLLDILEFCTVSVKFKGMSRIITQQLTRHRNAITQESQRYVDYSESQFNSPAMYKEEYDPDKLYNIRLDGTDYAVTLQSLGDMIASIYPQMLNQGLKREDARAYLPNNIQSNLYVTFTYKTLFHFLKLRLDKHAQAEIRHYANIIVESLFSTDEISKIFNVALFENEDFDKDRALEIIDEYLIDKAMYSEVYESNGIVEGNEEAIGDPIESIEELNKTAELADGEEIPDFGMAGSIPKSAKDMDAEEIYKQYNPEQYASTRKDN